MLKLAHGLAFRDLYTRDGAVALDPRVRFEPPAWTVSAATAWLAAS